MIAADQTLVLLSGLAILSYIFDIVSRRARIPAVLMLLGTGMLLRVAANRFHIPIPDMGTLLPVVGMLGLVLIVFEAALDLEIRRDRLKLAGLALAAAAAVLIGTVLLVGWLFALWTGAPFSQALINAAPLAVISSAVAIPSVAGLDENRREFIVYESTFSDILGILLFNFLIAGSGGSWSNSLLNMGMDILWVLLFSIACIAVMGWLLARTRAGSKLALVLAVLVLVFAIGKWTHLPTLLLIFAFGLSLSNARLVKGPLARVGIRLRDLLWEVRFLKRVTSETAFLVRTYFFVLFGLSISWASFFTPSILALGLAVFFLMTAIRVLLVSGILWRFAAVESLVAPRGLITILLFYSIPEEALIPQVSKDVLLVVLLASTLSMTGALLWKGREEEERPVVNPEVGAGGRGG